MRLERFLQAKAAEVAALRAAAEAGTLPPPLSGPRPDFTAALRRTDGLPAVIAEYKRASPSRGAICETLDVETAVREYAAAGANALSILTEEAFFHGNLGYLARAASALGDAAAPGQDSPARLPLLRKDFIFDILQVRRTAATPASALLLIVRLTPDAARLRRLREAAEGFGMAAVVEVFDQTDLDLARQSGARLIQVNARDLDTLAVDRESCLRLAAACPPRTGETWIAASGLSQRQHLRDAAEAGFSAVLAGSALMAGGRPGAALAALLDGQA